MDGSCMGAKMRLPPVLQDILEKCVRELGALMGSDSGIGLSGRKAWDPMVILGRFRTVT